MAIIISAMLAAGIIMTKFLPSDSLIRPDIYSLHKSFGVVALLLLIVRFANRIINKPPTLPEGLKEIEKIAANVSHKLLYLLMFLVPISGYLMSNSFGFRVKLFGIVMPKIIETNYKLAPIFAKMHHYFSYLILFLIIIHILATIKHRFFDKSENNVLNRMLFKD